MPGTRRRSRSGIVAGCALAGFALLLGPGGTANAAQARPAPDVHATVTGVVLRNQAVDPSDFCLDSSNSHGLRVASCNYTRYQNWTFTAKYAHTWEIRSQATGRCLDHSNSHGLRTFACNGSDYQRWDYSDDSYLQNVVTRDCVDYSPRYGLRAILCNGSYYQDWANEGNSVPGR